MKTRLLTVVAMVLCGWVAVAQEVQKPQSEIIMSGQAWLYNGGIKDASVITNTLAKISGQTTLVFDGGKWAVSNDLTFPLYTEVVMTPASYFDIATNCVVTFNAPMLATPDIRRHIFTGSGTVTGSVFATYGCEDGWTNDWTGSYYLTCLGSERTGEGYWRSTNQLGGDLQGVLTNAQIVAGSIGAADIAYGSITTSELADASVGSAEVINDSLTAADIFNKFTRVRWLSEITNFYTHGAALSGPVPWTTVDLANLAAIPTNADAVILSWSIESYDAQGCKGYIFGRKSSFQTLPVQIGGFYCSNLWTVAGGTVLLPVSATNTFDWKLDLYTANDGGNTGDLDHINALFYVAGYHEIW